MKRSLRTCVLGAIMAFAPVVGLSAQQAFPAPDSSETETAVADTLPPLSMPGWSVADNDSFVRRHAMSATPEGEQVRLDLGLMEPGYVALVVDENNTPFPGVTIFDGSGLSYPRASARITDPEGAYAIIDRPAGSVETDLTLKAWADIDITEPNDDSLLAWPLEIGATTEIILMPTGDQDVFRFTLEEETHLTLISDTEQRLQMQYLEPETERRITSGADVTLPAGNHLLRLSYANANHFDPVPFQLALVERQVAATVAEDDKRAVLDLGVPTHVPTTSANLARMILEVEEDGLYSFLASNVGLNANFEIVREDGELVRSSEVNLSEGTYSVNLYNVRKTRFPVMVSVIQNEVLDAFEPNDFHADATELELDDPVELIMERDLAVDWIRFTPKQEGKVFLMAEALDYRQGGCKDLQFNLLAKADPQELQPLTIIGPIAAQTYGPIEAVADEPLKIQILCASRGMTQSTTYRVRVDMPDLNRTNSNASVYLVGLELDDTLRGAMQMSSDISGVQFLEAEEAETLDERIEEIARAETQSGPSLWLILLIVALLGGGAAFWFLRPSRNAPANGGIATSGATASEPEVTKPEVDTTTLSKD